MPDTRQFDLQQMRAAAAQACTLLKVSKEALSLMQVLYQQYCLPSKGVLP